MKGTVKWYNVKNGYGFIVGEDEQDYFVHHTQIPDGVKLFEEDKVTFEPTENERGMQAQSIVKEGEEASSEEENTQEAKEPVEEEKAEESAPEAIEDPVEEEKDEAEEELDVAEQETADQEESAEEDVEDVDEAEEKKE